MPPNLASAPRPGNLEMRCMCSRTNRYESKVCGSWAKNESDGPVPDTQTLFPVPCMFDQNLFSIQGMLGGLDMMFQGPSVKDGLTLGAITEDPREDMVSEFTVSRG